MPELFMASCGATTALRLLVTGLPKVSPREHLFDHPFIRVGRLSDNCLPLDDPAISERHAYLQMIDGQLLCIDLESRTGVAWPGGVVRPSGWLTAPSGMRIGPCWICPRNTGTDQAAGSAHPRVQDPLGEKLDLIPGPRVAVEIANEQRFLARTLINRALVLVGSAPSCRIRLGHPDIERIHCSLVWNRHGLWLVDLLSREGTWLNGTRVPWARLADGDEVRIGSYRLRFWYQAEGSLQEQASRVTLVSTAAADESTPGSFPPLTPLSVPDTTKRDDLLPMSLAQGLLPAGLSETGLESGLLPVVQQFGLMQQQLFEQFQQTTLMLFRMFANMHQEQVAVLREEIQHIQRTTNELQALQQQLRDCPPPAPAKAAQSKANDTKPGEATPPGTAPSRPVRIAPPDFLADTADEAPARPAVATETAPPSGPAVDPAAVHSWLSKRIEELQVERQSRWQRVLNFTRGAT
jgi:pSer/pThr/pTyr-binding forkhead associated (FHA) protein